MNPSFPCGIVEGFYGRPWTHDQRRRIVGWLKRFGLNTYLYGPKDDLKHRVLWREPLDAAETAAMRDLIRLCDTNGVEFHYAVAPGWDAHFGPGRPVPSPPALLAGLQERFRPLIDLGCRGLAVMFDDVPGLEPAALGEIGKRHAEVANALSQWLVAAGSGATRLALCPAVYCTRMAGASPGESTYLRALGQNLLAEVNVYWTGPEIISPTIDAGHLREVAEVLRRPPFLWDNLHANDYDNARVFLGPYAGRSGALPGLTRGLVLNPNRECALNFTSLATLGEFIRSVDGYAAESALERAVSAWLPDWECVTGDLFNHERIALVVDCFFLPFAQGRRATALMDAVRTVLHGGPAEIGDALDAVRAVTTELSGLFFDLGALRDRDLFEALWPHVWRLKDELGLVLAIGDQRIRGTHPPFATPEHPPGVFRGGLLGDLRELIQPVPGGFRVR